MAHILLIRQLFSSSSAHSAVGSASLAPPGWEEQYSPDTDSAPHTTQWLDLKWLSIRILPAARPLAFGLTWPWCEKLKAWAPEEEAVSYRPARLVRGIESYQCSTSAPTRLNMRDRGGMRRLRM